MSALPAVAKYFLIMEILVKKQREKIVMKESNYFI